MRDEPVLTGRAGVSLEGPRPLGQGGRPAAMTLPAVSSVPVPVQPAGVVNSPVGYSYEQLQGMLAARGVTRQQLRSTGVKDEWQFTCSIPDPQKPNYASTTEATAVGPGGLAAIWAAIQQIDRARTVKASPAGSAPGGSNTRG
jgi:hypothetical protein